MQLMAYALGRDLIGTAQRGRSFQASPKLPPWLLLDWQ